MKIHLIPILLGLSWLALIWLWLFRVLPVNVESVIAFIFFFLGAIVTEAVGESNDEKKPPKVTVNNNTGIDDQRLRKIIVDEISKSMRRN